MSGKVRRDHGATAHEAADRIEGASGKQRAAVLAEIIRSGELGRTDGELAEMLDLNPSSARPRRIELVEAGLIVDSGRTRKTASGRASVVWREATRAERLRSSQADQGSFSFDLADHSGDPPSKGEPE